MRRMLFTSFLFLSFPPAHLRPHHYPTSLFLYHFDPPSFLEFSEDFQLMKEIPFSIPVNCGLYDIFPAQLDRSSCRVELPQRAGGSFSRHRNWRDHPALSQHDSHFLAWQSDGLAAYLKVDSFTNPRILRAFVNGAQEICRSVSSRTTSLPDRTRAISLSRFHADWATGVNCTSPKTTGALPNCSIPIPSTIFPLHAFPRTGRQIAFIKIPDLQTPFTVGELWVMDADGSNARKLADGRRRSRLRRELVAGWDEDRLCGTRKPRG
jgi:hypothetical protein